ncbi:MAG: Transport protein [uncultured bacterium (gcode 4)]|uniref:Transport protein n=1 Tax=uncultured bacterium (gcode 4) TaxID=1234023 RepID=K2F4U1_9BACT|nr:MAG: Transport protein [uncultured bacterium (gcode 4)]
MDTLKKTAERNIKLYTWINFLSWILFLAPVIWALKYLVWLSIPQIILISNILTLTVWLFELPTSLIADTIWRKKSLVYSVISNFVASAVIFIFPTYIWFIIASFFGWLYFSFWSWAWQAFLDENLKICWRQKDFWKLIWDFWFAEKFGSLITPILASLILLLTKNFDEIIGYRILAFLDVFVSLFLVIMVFKLIDTTIITENISWIRNILNDNIKTAKKWLKNVFYNSKLRLILIYRSLSNHVAFFYVILLPFLLKQWMPDWYSWIIITISAIWAMLASKFSYKISEKFSYNFSWVFSSVIQWILLIIAWFVLKNWILVILIYIIFDIFEHLWYPAWNHIVVENSQGIAVATTRSIIFWIFALYTTVWKQFLALFPIEYALVWSWIFILGINLIFWKKILELKTI